MATKQTNDGAGTGTEPAPQEAPTPENTPKPGGGSWRWDASVPGWVENTYA